MRYKVGDKVVLRDDLEANKIYTGVSNSVDVINRVVGRQTTIKSKHKGYYIAEDELHGFGLSDDMIDHERTAELQRNKKITVFQKEKAEELGITPPPIPRRSNGNVNVETQAVMEDLLGDAIKPAHYRKGEIDLYESWYQTRPFNEYRAIMEAIAERYIKRDKENRVEDLEKAIYTLERLKEKEEEND